MGKVNPDALGGGGPKVTQDDLENDIAVLTVTEYEELTVKDAEADGGKRISAVLRFEETGDKALWLNAQMVRDLIAWYGDDSDDWIGKAVPVEKYTAKFGSKEFPKVRVMLADEWTAVFDEVGINVPQRADGANKVTKPASRVASAPKAAAPKGRTTTHSVKKSGRGR